MIKQLATWQFWAMAIIAGPVALVVLIGAFIALKKEVKAVRKWYYGLPIYQYPAMLMIVLGARHITKPFGEWKKFEGRWWFTVKTDGFVPEEKP